MKKRAYLIFLCLVILLAIPCTKLLADSIISGRLIKNDKEVSVELTQSLENMTSLRLQLKVDISEGKLEDLAFNFNKEITSEVKKAYITKKEESQYLVDIIISGKENIFKSSSNVIGTLTLKPEKEDFKAVVTMVGENKENAVVKYVDLTHSSVENKVSFHVDEVVIEQKEETKPSPSESEESTKPLESEESTESTKPQEESKESIESTKSQESTCKKHQYESKVTKKATTKKLGVRTYTCKVCGKSYTKSIPYIKTVTLSTSSYTYNGKVRKPSVKIIGSDKKKISTSNYTVVYPKGRKNVGKYIVTIKLKGSYTGTIQKSFTIHPKATTIKTIKKASKGFDLTWKKVSSQITGYQIQYATSKNFKGVKTVTVSNKKTSKSIRKLKSKKKYYVRICTYKTVKVNKTSTKICSNWSQSKSIVTK